MAAYLLSDKAEADLTNLYAYSITSFGLAVARDYFLGIHEIFELLGSNPMIGVATDYVRPGLQRFPHQSHVIYYRIEPSGVRITRVLHSAQNPLLHALDD